MIRSITEHIAAGQYKAAQDSSDIFQAYLGTCVGVALYDKVRKTGGMIHILLPEPPGMSQPDYPEKYASTGIPVLIREIAELGSRPEDLKATIAGGALVGPVSHQDMGLDIGGRSADIAQTILKDYGIEIIKSETGGFFTCTLELDMGTGKTWITPAWGESQLTSADIAPPSPDDIDQTIANLKPIPQTALKILRMVQSGTHNINDVARELSQDQVLSAQTLKICNSALFAGTVRVDTLKDAVLLLGQDMLVKSVITAAVETYYDQTGTSGYSLCRGGLFFHAVGVATAAELLAEKSGKADSKQAYTAGLLHDIGKVVLDQYIAQSAPLLFRQLGEARENFLNSEQKFLGITHCSTGGILARQWQFSKALSQVIRFHHLPEAADDHKDLVAIVYLADLLMEKFLTGFDLEKMQTRSIKSVLRRLGLTAGDIPEIMDAFPLAALVRQDDQQNQKGQNQKGQNQI